MRSRASEQLPSEETHTSLASFLRAGGHMEVGYDPATDTFLRIRKWNKAIAVQGVHGDFVAILKQLDSSAREFLQTDPVSDK